MADCIPRAAPTLQTCRAREVENGYCLNIQLIWDAPAVTTVNMRGMSSVCVCVCMYHKFNSGQSLYLPQLKS